MFSTIVLFLVLLFFAFFIKYKRDLFMRIFSLDTAKSTRELQEQLRNTGNDIIRQMTDQAAHLEYLLEEADQKIILLEKKLAAIEQLVPEVGLARRNIAPPSTAQVISAYTFPDISIKDQNTLKKKSTLENQDTLPPVPLTAVLVAAPSSVARETANGDKRRVVTVMAEQGYDITEIAKATGIGQGEITLLLQLNKQQSVSVPQN